MRYNYLNFLTKQLGNSQEINIKSNEIVSFYTVKPKCSIKNIYKKNIFPLHVDKKSLSSLICCVNIRKSIVCVMFYSTLYTIQYCIAWSDIILFREFRKPTHIQQLSIRYIFLSIQFQKILGPLQILTSLTICTILPLQRTLAQNKNRKIQKKRQRRSSLLFGGQNLFNSLTR